MRRVAHAVLWGDGLRFRVQDGRLPYLPSTTLDRRLPLVSVPRLQWSPGADCSAPLPCPGARQQIRISRWRVTPGASTLGRGFPVTGVHTYTHPHPRTHAHTQVTARQNQFSGSVRPGWGRAVLVEVHRVRQSPKREVWPHDDVGVSPQHTTGKQT